MAKTHAASWQVDLCLHALPQRPCVQLYCCFCANRNKKVYGLGNEMFSKTLSRIYLFIFSFQMSSQWNSNTLISISLKTDTSVINTLNKSLSQVFRLLYVSLYEATVIIPVCIKNTKYSSILYCAAITFVLYYYTYIIIVTMQVVFSVEVGVVYPQLCSRCINNKLWMFVLSELRMKTAHEYSLTFFNATIIADAFFLFIMFHT